MTAICYECLEDEYLKELVQGQCDPEECSICGNTENPAIDIEELGRWMEPILREHFQEGQMLKRFYDDDTEGWEQTGEDLSWVVQEVLGQYLDCEDELIDAIIEAENVIPGDGEYNFWDSTTNYVATPVRIGHLLDEWHAASYEIKHQSRFFSTSATFLFDRVFAGIHELHEVTAGVPSPVVFEMPTGTRLYRARVCIGIDELTDFYKEPYAQVGPPPNHRARAGRMNAEGIVVFYGATETDTCLSELRPALGSWTVAIELETTKPLRILDFTKLARVRGSEPLSYFDSNFTPTLEMRKFLKQLHFMISRPVVPGAEGEYLITQTMAEYLSIKMDKPVDGIIYSSAQKANGANVVLFPKSTEERPEFNIQYVPDSVALYVTEEINYKHTEQLVYRGPDSDLTVVLNSDDYPDWDDD